MRTATHRKKLWGRSCGGEGAGGPLTRREREVARLLEQGKTDKEIGSRLCISEGTVGEHLRSVFRKLGVHTRTAAVMRVYGRALSEA